MSAAGDHDLFAARGEPREPDLQIVDPQIVLLVRVLFGQDNQRAAAEISGRASLLPNLRVELVVLCCKSTRVQAPM